MTAFLQGLNALRANVFSTEHNDILCVVAENAGRLILFQNDRSSVHVDLQGILFGDVQGAAQFDRENNTAQLIDFSYDSGRLHFTIPFFLLGQNRRLLRGEEIRCTRRFRFYNYTTKNLPVNLLRENIAKIVRKVIDRDKKQERQEENVKKVHV